MPEVKLMTPLFDGGMYNRTGRRMRAVFIKEVADGTTTYRLWRKDGKPEIEYPRCDNDRYILHVEVNSYLIPLRMTEFQMIDNCGYLPAVNELYRSLRRRDMALHGIVLRMERTAVRKKRIPMQLNQSEAVCHRLLRREQEADGADIQR